MMGSQDISFRDNSLTIVRYLAAFSVMYGHVMTHLAIPRDNVFIRLLGLFCGHFPGVPIFFFMSGYLIWRSVCRTTDIREYYKKRFGRIYPELWMAVALSILAILVFVRPISWVKLSLFTITQSTFMQFWTPSFLRDFGCGCPNGSLWTICVLIQFYAVAPFICPLLRGKNLELFVIIAGGGLSSAMFCHSLSVSFSGPDSFSNCIIRRYYPIFGFFFWGVWRVSYIQNSFPY